MVYLIFIIIFLGLIFFLQKNQNKQIETIQREGQKNTSFKDIAKILGLHFEERNKEHKTSSSVFSHMNRIWGNYKGIPLEILFQGKVKVEQGLQETLHILWKKRLLLRSKTKKTNPLIFCHKLLQVNLENQQEIETLILV